MMVTAGRVCAACAAALSITANAAAKMSYERLAKAGIEQSVRSADDSDDNALVETINGLCSTEVIHRRRLWRSFESVEHAALE